MSRRELLALTALGLVALPAGFAEAAEAQGQLTWGIHVSLAPSWFDPSEATGIITPFMVLYALHDAMVKPMPGKVLAPSLAESWSMSEDGRSYDFVLRQGCTFHNGDPVTADDVKFSFDRYHGTAHQLMRDRVAAIEIADPRHVRFLLKDPWPDFLTFYATVTGAGWIVPKNHIEKVGEEAFKKAPVGAGPYKFVSFQPGLELTLEAFAPYWRKPPTVKRLIFRVIPDEATRLAALKNGEVDIAYSIRGELAEELRQTPGLTLKPAVVQGVFCLYFADQWDPKSPWHDERVRRAASLAIDRKGKQRRADPRIFTDNRQPDRAGPLRILLATAAPGLRPGGCQEAARRGRLSERVRRRRLQLRLLVCQYRRNAGRQSSRGRHPDKLRPIERAAYVKQYTEKKLKNLVQAGPGAFGNAATRIETNLLKNGIFSYGGYPDIEELYQQQAAELDRKKREGILHKIQQIMVERVIYAPIWQLAFINGVGSRVAESGFGQIARFPYTSPYEDITVKGS